MALPSVTASVAGFILGVLAVVDGTFLMGVAAIISSITGLVVALTNRPKYRRRRR